MLLNIVKKTCAKNFICFFKFFYTFAVIKKSE